MRTHLISQVLLRRYVSRSKVKVNDLYSSSYKFEKPEDLAYIDFPDELVAKLEHNWGYIESRMATAFQALDRGEVLRSEKDKETIKRFMSIHFARSNTLIELMKTKEKKYFDMFIQSSIDTYPDKKEEILNNVKDLRTSWMSGLYKSIPYVMRRNIKKVEEYILSQDLEIGYATGGTNFYLGDIPVVNANEEGKVGVLSGVGLTQSIGFMLPLGPKHMGALISRNANKEYIPLENRYVKAINEKIQRQSLSHFYSFPRSHEAVF